MSSASALLFDYVLAYDDLGRALEVVPPLSRAATWIEILAAGPSAQARITLPLRWQ
jgi:hypothetical protein